MFLSRDHSRLIIIVTILKKKMKTPFKTNLPISVQKKKKDRKKERKEYSQMNRVVRISKHKTLLFL